MYQGDTTGITTDIGDPANPIQKDTQSNGYLTYRNLTASAKGPKN
jgi:hypothetical protein